MPTILISYRRSDSKWITGRIVDRLERDYGKSDVFVDIDAIPFGMDFRDHLRNVLDRCDVLVAVIGPNWLAADEFGQPRILEPTDWVRIEIESALTKSIPVIPVLIDRAPMPKVADLPESLHAFAFRQAADVDSGRDFHVHMDRLVRAISQSAAAPRPIAQSAPPGAREQSHHVAPMQHDEPHADAQHADIAPEPPAGPKRHRGLIAAVVAAACVAGIAVLLTQKWPDRPTVIATGPSEPAPTSQDQAAPEPSDPPALPDAAASQDQPAPVDPPLQLDPPSVDTAAPSDTPTPDVEAPSDRPIPPGLIEQPQVQRVLLFEADKPSSAGRQFSGNVTWRTVKTSAFPGQLPALAARADIVIPDRQLTVTLSLRINTDPNLPASHTVEVSFRLPPGFAPGAVSDVPSVLMKDSDDVRGAALAGLSTQVRPGVFMIGLSGIGSDRARNIQMLKSRAWFDIAIVYGNGARAVLTVEKGADGDRVFKQVFAAWRQ